MLKHFLSIKRSPLRFGLSAPSMSGSYGAFPLRKAKLAFLAGVLLICLPAARVPNSTSLTSPSSPSSFCSKPGKNRLNFLTGFTAGIVSYTGLTDWVVVAMNTFGGISIPFSVVTLCLFVLYLSLFTACFTWLISFLDNRLHIPLFLSAPPCRGAPGNTSGAFSCPAFPWSFLAHSQYNFLPLIQVASVTGTYFLSFLIVGVNCLIYDALTKKRFPLVWTALSSCAGLPPAWSSVFTG